MARRPDLIPPVSLHTALPADLHARMTLHLYSPAEGRVPKAAYSRFITRLVAEFFASKEPTDAQS